LYSGFIDQKERVQGELSSRGQIVEKGERSVGRGVPAFPEKAE